MTTAEIITIGTELLLGEIQDTNTRYMARNFRQLGINLYRVSIVGDNTLRIADMIKESLARADLVITSGGLGPTVDDPTRSAVALAFNVDVVFHPELWEQIHNRFSSRGYQPSDNNKKQAFLPDGAKAIPNPVGTAPAFYNIQGNKMVISLPGVPAEMEKIFTDSVVPLVRDHFHLNELIKTRVLHTIGIGESSLDSLIADLETGGNPTVGLSAHPASVDIRITAKSTSDNQAEKMIAAVENEIRRRIPDVIFGFDGETITSVINRLALQNNLLIQIHWYEPNPVDPEFKVSPTCDSIQIIKHGSTLTPSDIPNSHEHSICYGVNVHTSSGQGGLELMDPLVSNATGKVLRFLGPDAHLHAWALNSVYNYIWQQLRSINQESK